MVFVYHVGNLNSHVSNYNIREAPRKRTTVADWPPVYAEAAAASFGFTRFYSNHNTHTCLQGGRVVEIAINRHENVNQTAQTTCGRKKISIK